MTLDVAEALCNDTSNHRHHHDHRLDMTLDVAEALSNDTRLMCMAYYGIQVFT